MSIVSRCFSSKDSLLISLVQGTVFVTHWIIATSRWKRSKVFILFSGANGSMVSRSISSCPILTQVNRLNSIASLRLYLINIMEICSIIIRNALRRWAVLLAPINWRKSLLIDLRLSPERKKVKKFLISIGGSREKYRQSLRFSSSLGQSPRHSKSDLGNLHRFLIWLWFVWLNDCDHPKRSLFHVHHISNSSVGEKTHRSFYFSFDFLFFLLCHPFDRFKRTYPISFFICSRFPRGEEWRWPPFVGLSFTDVT